MAKDKSDMIMGWIAEHDHILAIDKENPGPDFNNDPACFKRYCTMQGNAAIKAGATQIGNEILAIAKDL